MLQADRPWASSQECIHSWGRVQLTSCSSNPVPLNDFVVLNFPCNESHAYFRAWPDLHSIDLSVWLLTLHNEIPLPAIKLISYHHIKPDPNTWPSRIIVPGAATSESNSLIPKTEASLIAYYTLSRWMLDERPPLPHPQLGFFSHPRIPFFIRTDHGVETTEHSALPHVALFARALAKL